MRGHALYGLAVAIAAGVWSAAHAAPPVVTSPNWVKRPDAYSLLSVYPVEAERKGVSGAAKIRCVVTAKGALDQCVIVDESPPDWGFGDAALALSRTLLMSPRLVDGVPTGGAIVTIPLRFDLPPKAASNTVSPDSKGLASPEVKYNENPDWIRRPDAYDVGRAYPATAMSRGVSGTVRLDCAITDEGRLRPCSVVSETPDGWDFGAAALSLAPLFAMRPIGADGKPVGGKHISLPIAFRAPKE